MPFYDLDPEALKGYRSSVAPPADFDEFWTATLAEARECALEAVFTPIDYGLSLVNVFDVSFGGFGGHPVRGWMIEPSGGASSCVVKYIGYDSGRGLPHEHLLWPSTGRTVFVMDTRGQGSAWGVGDTADPVGSGPAHAGSMTRGIEHPSSYFYRRVFTDAIRAIDAVRSRTETNPDKIAVCGVSQGGAIALAAASLDRGVACAMADVPFLCDFPRAVGLAPRDPYGEIARYLAMHRDKVDAVFSTLNYFDCVNLVRRAKAPALFSVAMMDAVCPPSTVYAAYNAYAGEKEIAVYRFNDHEGGGPFQERRQIEWLAQHL
jgi:cephalosporin-C deacetylase